MAFSPSDLQNSYGPSTSSFRNSLGNMQIPHCGALSRLEGEDDATYILEIQLEDGSTHELQFLRNDFDFSLRLFAIMDSESRGQISKATVHEFVTLRCPVFWRRDDDLRAMRKPGTSPTFEEVWREVATCSVSVPIDDSEDLSSVELGVEGWMVFCRFIALAQYMEAKRRFSGRHLQQTMRHRNGPRGSEVVVVDVPPAAPPVLLSASQLAQYERESNKCLPLPELDLDHSLLAAHDVLRRRKDITVCRGRVKIDVFGASQSLLASGSSQHLVEFCLTYCRDLEDGRFSDSVSVRRSMKDMKWLNDTLKTHRTLGGTLCGRILPPFPGKLSTSQFDDESALGSTGEAIAAAATAGVGILKQGIKSIWGNYITSPKNGSALTNERGPATASKSTKVSMQTRFGLPSSYYNPNSPAGKARQLERYLNYLLEHPALSTSFPLNTILKASQSGLEAAKQSLEEHTRASTAINEQAPKLDDGKLAQFWPMHGASSMQPNLSWVRTAAQAAVALQLHGVLETTGLQSASARLQHASLPKFDNSRDSGWNDDSDVQLKTDSDDTPSSNEENFEEGVCQVQDGLETDEMEDSAGYDLLPLPVPAPERRILTLSDTRPHKIGSKEMKETRFRYGDSPHTLPGLAEEIAGKSALLGDIAVDENIDKLREVIGSVDNTLSRSMASSSGIGRARRERLALHLDIVRGLDFWEGLRGKFVAQRALLKGVSGIEQSREVFEDSDLALIDDVSWQTALASSAVSAAEDVRSAVRAARTASNARTAATSAAVSAQKACDTRKFNSIDEARAAQTRASIAQSHAIHAAVVDHEAKTVKRRATLALAHDVKCWNAHRKREIIQTALAYAKSQHEATRRAVDAWSCLRDGYVGSTIIPSTQARRAPPPRATADMFGSDDVEATIFANSDDTEEEPTIVAIEHELLKKPEDGTYSTTNETMSSPLHETILPFVVASPIPEEDDDVGSSRGGLDEFSMDPSPHAHEASIGVTQSLGSSMFLNPGKGSPIQTKSNFHSQIMTRSSSRSKLHIEGEETEVLTSSMQSLVNGLMNWGGQYDDDEDFALPTGMAASIALEESGVLGSHGKIV